MDGFDYDCLPESLLRLLQCNKMIQVRIADRNASKWKREACEAVRDHLCSHDDERLRPVQRDQRNCVCDVYSDQHKIAYLKHFNHAAFIVSYFANSLALMMSMFLVAFVS